MALGAFLVVISFGVSMYLYSRIGRHSKKNEAAQPAWNKDVFKDLGFKQLDDKWVVNVTVKRVSGSYFEVDAVVCKPASVGSLPLQYSLVRNGRTHFMESTFHYPPGQPIPADNFFAMHSYTIYFVHAGVWYRVESCEIVQQRYAYICRNKKVGPLFQPCRDYVKFYNKPHDAVVSEKLFGRWAGELVKKNASSFLCESLRSLESRMPELPCRQMTLVVFPAFGTASTINPHGACSSSPSRRVVLDLQVSPRGARSGGTVLGSVFNSSSGGKDDGTLRTEISDTSTVDFPGPSVEVNWYIMRAKKAETTAVVATATAHGIASQRNTGATFVKISLDSLNVTRWHGRNCIHPPRATAEAAGAAAAEPRLGLSSGRKDVQTECRVPCETGACGNAWEVCAAMDDCIGYVYGGCGYRCWYDH
jgi:hypothetical protein